jgi:hypothetical protein
MAALAFALLLLAGCATRKSSGIVAVGAWPLADDVRFQLGTIALAPDSLPAKYSFDKASGQIKEAGEEAGAAAGRVLGICTPDPVLNLPLGVVTAVVAPVAAVASAVEARQQLSPEQLSDCEVALHKAMSEMADQQRFHDCLLKAAGEQCRGRLVPLGQLPASGLAAPDSVLQARVEELRLERRGSSDTSFQLRIKTRTRLVRVADGAVLCDHVAEYRSDPCLFLDWTLKDGFKGVAETGYRKLAEQCAGRLLATSDRPVLVGAGYRGDSARPRNSSIQFAANQTGSGRPATLFASFPVAQDVPLGIYSGENPPHVVIQRPLSRDDVGTEALNDMDYMFDGLQNHPNMLVALPAIAVAIPIGLWKQGEAVVRGFSPSSVRDADINLHAAASQARPQQELTFQVAAQLASQTSLPVALLREPPRPNAHSSTALVQSVSYTTLSSSPGRQVADAAGFDRDADTALEIRVQSAGLTGKSGINPTLALGVEARATLLRTSDGRELYSCPMQYRSQVRKFKEWGAHDAELFREELRKCYHDLGAAMVEQLVGRGVVPPDRTPQPTIANVR